MKTFIIKTLQSVTTKALSKMSKDIDYALKGLDTSQSSIISMEEAMKELTTAYYILVESHNLLTRKVDQLESELLAEQILPDKATSRIFN